jgi:hypothetical protein
MSVETEGKALAPLAGGKVVSRTHPQRCRECAKVEAELSEAVELLKPFAEAWEKRPPDYDNKGRRFTMYHADFRRAFEFVKAHTPGPQACQGVKLKPRIWYRICKQQTIWPSVVLLRFTDWRDNGIYCIELGFPLESPGPQAAQGVVN